jgi:hypothetical protein
MANSSTLRRALAGLAVAAALVLTCTDIVPTESVEDHRLAIDVLTAAYNPQTGEINLTWSTPTGAFDYYRIYRTTVTDTLGNPVLETMVSTLRRDSIPRGVNSLVDMPEPAEGVYFYGIRAVRIEDGVHKEGVLSPEGNLTSVVVGFDVAFSINHGDEFTLTKQCSLFVSDPGLVLSSVRFTQVQGDSVATGGPAPISGDIRNQVRDLVDYKFLTGVPVSGTVGPVNFDVSDGEAGNAGFATYDAARGMWVKAWTLLDGSGQKNVWAEVTYGGATRDTIMDFIMTQPHKVELVLRNSTAVAGGTVKDTLEDYVTPEGDSSSIRMLVFYNDVIRFSVKIFGDSAIEQDFDYWLLVNVGWSEATSSIINRRGWVMTMPKDSLLTGRGVLHSSEQVYTLSLETGTVDGDQTLDTLLFGRSGSVLGLSDTGSPYEHQLLFDELKTSPRYDNGKKQFLLVARFRERFFGGSFVRVLGQASALEEEFRTYRDNYPPYVRYDASVSNPYHIAEGDTINKPFTFALDTISAEDRGLARITDLKLAIAKLPVGYPWDPAVSPAQMTSEEFYNFSHEIYPFLVEKPGSVIMDAVWEDIDPTNWTTGRYLMALVVTDDRGYTGFADVDTSKAGKNPFSVFISTSN